ncbi:hypothetical protein H1235_04580 [Pseudoxanthomonas sp. NC8]|nr:hypothetical protein H1235_04580 [Pseudoxanthomonas sp. NC8]
MEHDRTWIGTRAGVAVLRQGHVETPAVLAPMKGVQVNGIVRDRAGRLWFATAQGLYQLAADGRLSHYGQAQGLPDPRVRLVHETRGGRLLIGTHNGLYEWRQGVIVALGSQTGFDNDTTISAIHELDDGRWIVGSTTGQELRLFDGRRWIRLGRAQGIPANVPFFITTARGYLWVAGMTGIYRVPLQQLDHLRGDARRPLAAEIVVNSGSDRPGGQPDICCNGAGNSRGLLLGDMLWLPTREGALLLDTAMTYPAVADPSVLVERVQAGPMALSRTW